MQTDIPLLQPGLCFFVVPAFQGSAFAPLLRNGLCPPFQSGVGKCLKDTERNGMTFVKSFTKKVMDKLVEDEVLYIKVL